MNQGKVWLVGAGPGDAGLLTIKAKEVIEKAQVIVYDALVSGEILSLLPVYTADGDPVEYINVGKRSGNHLVPQEEINQILLQKAREGFFVVRLKGGDPFVFGRGGEELELLVEAKIPFEVVPGVASPIAVPAYAGIPVTHRDYTSSFHIVTGHARKGGEERVDYKALVQLDGTLVFLMGIASLGRIMKGLIEAGMDQSTPAAVLERGTTARQKTLISTIGNLEKDAEEKGIKTPAIIMVGKVCELHHQFHWVTKRPLSGHEIVVTRPRERSSRLAGKLRDLGAQILELPAIETVRIKENERFAEAIKNIGERLTNEKSDQSMCEVTKEWIVFTSPKGVESFFENLIEWHLDLRQILKENVEFAVIGSGTRNVLAEKGILADLIPKEYNAKNLGQLLAERIQEEHSAHVHVTMFRAALGSEEIFPPLNMAGIPYEDVAVYETKHEVHPQIRERIEELFAEDAISEVIFTSASTVEGFAAALPNLDYTMIHAICIGAQTAEKAREMGMQISISKEATLDSLVECVLEHTKETLC